MITRQFINEQSTKLQTSEENVAREYCQHLFLSYLYRKQKSGKMLFKGGTALRIIFDSPRFSEDLDFSAYGLSVSDINQLIDAVLKNIEEEGITCGKKLNPGTEGETSGGYFAVVRLQFLGFDNEIRIQVSLRKNDEPEADSALIESDFTPPYTLVYLAEKKLVAEKVSALLERSKPRDYFDLYFVLRHRALKQYIPGDIDGLKEKLLKVLRNGWEKELKLFLPASYRPLLRDFPERLKKEIEMHMPN